MPSVATRPAHRHHTDSPDARELERAIRALERAHWLYLSRRTRLHRDLSRARLLLHFRRDRLECLIERHAPTVNRLTNTKQAG